MRAGLLLAAILAVACKRDRAPAPDASLAGRDPAVLVRDACLMCHDETMLSQQRLTPAQWSAVTKKMQGWGAPLAGDEAPRVASYLAGRYGLNAPPVVLAEVDARAAADSLRPTPDGPLAGGDAREGARIYGQACATCHGAKGHGDALGTNLADRPLLYRAAEFADAVRRGRRQMPEFALGDREVGALLAYLRGLR
jgi:mono/diheme cytochrome c family protein